MQYHYFKNEQRTTANCILNQSLKGMGRTQVARNQRKGRPGDRGKGRGRGGGRGRDEQGESHKKSTKQAARFPLGGNSFRYDSYDNDRKDHNNGQEVNDADVDEWEHLAIGDQYKYVPTNRSLPMDDTIGIGFGDKHDDDSNMNVGQKQSLDISKLASCLEKLNSAVWMRFSDDDLLRDYDDRIGKKGEEKMTISEMAACSIPIQVECVPPVSSPVSAPALVDDISIKIEKELKISSDDENNIDNKSNSSSDGQEGDDDDDDDDDDLDAWLDEVIEI